MRRIFGPKQKELKRKLRNMHKEYHYNASSSYGIVRVIILGSI
jgi:hypothetical protein